MNYCVRSIKDSRYPGTCQLIQLDTEKVKISPSLDIARAIILWTILLGCSSKRMKGLWDREKKTRPLDECPSPIAEGQYGLVKLDKNKTNVHVQMHRAKDIYAIVPCVDMRERGKDSIVRQLRKIGSYYAALRNMIKLSGKSLLPDVQTYEKIWEYQVVRPRGAIFKKKRMYLFKYQAISDLSSNIGLTAQYLGILCKMSLFRFKRENFFTFLWIQGKVIDHFNLVC